MVGEMYNKPLPGATTKMWDERRKRHEVTGDAAMVLLSPHGL